MSRLVFSLLLLLSGGLSSFAAQSEKSAEIAPSRAATIGADYILQPSDLIRVQIFQEDDLNREIRISRECTVMLPLIETVNLTGKTARQAEDYIRSLYAKDYLTKPQVNLSVLEYVPRRVYVFGAVGTPGPVTFQQEQGLTLLEAISKAGSFNRLAKRKNVTLKRIKPDGSAELTTINVDDLLKGDGKGDGNLAYPLQPEDVINVPEIVM